MKTQHDDTRFDALMRERYREATAHLPGPLRLQLIPTIAAQRRAASAPARRMWPAATAFASLALAIGLWWSPAIEAPSDARRAQPALATVSGPTGEAADATDLLVRNPDFYAWLGSDEARSLAME